MREVNGAVLLNLHQIDLITLLLQKGKRTANGGVFQTSGDDVPASVPFRVRNSFDRKVVGLAGTACENQFLRLNLQQFCHMCSCSGNGFFGRQSRMMFGVWISHVRYSSLTIAVQDTLVYWRVGSIVQINLLFIHSVLSFFFLHAISPHDVLRIFDIFHTRQAI